MDLFKLLFRAAKTKSRLRSRRTSVIITTRHTTTQSTTLQPRPVSDKIYSEKDVDRIQSLPTAKVEHVIDGDTVIVTFASSKLKIRLDSIDCPEHGQEWGDIATRGLIKLIGGKTVQLETHGTDVYGRTLGTLFVHLREKGEWQNVNDRMVTLGHAWVTRLSYDHLPKSRQQKLNQLERWAKSKRVGLWKTKNQVPPWKWRKS